MKTRFLFILLTLISASTLAQSDSSLIDGNPTIIGEAFDIKSKELRYREYHFYSASGLEHRVVYKDPDDNIIAEKTLHYGGLLSEPSVEQQNTLCGEYFQVVDQSDNNRLQIVYRAKEGKRRKEKLVKKPGDLVVDAGFDHYLQAQWDNLVAGKTVEFNYLAPSRLRTYSFKAEAVTCKREGEVRCFVIEPDVWYLNIALDPILLTYSSNGRNLLAFTGLGNVADKRCDYMAVDIRYEYPHRNL